MRLLVILCILLFACNYQLGEKRYYYVDAKNDNEIFSLQSNGTNISFSAIYYPVDSTFIIDGSIRRFKILKFGVFNFEIENRVPDTMTLISHAPLNINHFNNNLLFVNDINESHDSLISFTTTINNWNIRKENLNLKLNFSLTTESNNIIVMDTIFSLKSKIMFNTH